MARTRALLDADPGVLLITDDFPVGGLERIVVGLAAELRGRGRRVGVLADRTGEMWAEVPTGVERFPVDTHGVIAAMRLVLFLRSMVRSGRFRVLHAHQRRVALLARIAAVGTNAVVVEHVHNVFRADPVSRLLSFRSKLLVACAPQIGSMLVHEFRRPAASVRVVLNGVADPGVRAAGMAAPRILRIVGAGRLVPQKDPIRFVRTIGALASRRAPGSVRAVWLGDGELMGDVVAERSRLGLDDVIELPGQVGRPATWFADASCLMLTSAHEGLPLVALETLASGRGAVLPDIGGCASAIDGTTGLLYEPGLSPADLGALLDEHLTPDRIAAWSRSARARYEHDFTFARMADQVVAVYDEALSSGGRRSAPLPVGHAA